MPTGRQHDREKNPNQGKPQRDIDKSRKSTGNDRDTDRELDRNGSKGNNRNR